MIREDKRPLREHTRYFNALTAPEIATIMDYEPAGPRDIALRLNNGSLKRINELHPSYDPPPIPNHIPVWDR